ncbi:type VI secretion protein [Altericroceibacterium spongiae]|uniref:Type VI secretion protein n=1 Tax=Altericroceibacterium spongiae TaxID=2320269 RepID=A0A420ESC0_9SPHN|nr:TrbG/VirB9 family P-type conjugative transfer protein [Altericroceibacterium spongiae]RKF23571.1 type VI secretion protein [Altericroceibacterium spongiae]
MSTVCGALALSFASPAAADPRLIDHLYNPDEVVRIQGHLNVQATIKFNEDEHIENVAIGDSNAWQVTPNKRANLLFVKPIEANAMTNMTVVTDQHTYFFDLDAAGKGTPVYVLAFSYPKEVEPAPKGPPIPSEKASPVEMAAATDPYAVIDPQDINRKWAGSGDEKLLPVEAYDDGDSTFLTWPVGRPVPAILVKDHEGTEGPVNFAVRGDVIVVDGVPREIILRSGPNTATLINNGPVRESGRDTTRSFARAEEIQ